MYNNVYNMILSFKFVLLDFRWTFFSQKFVAVPSSVKEDLLMVYLRNIHHV